MTAQFHRQFIKQYRKAPQAVRAKCDERLLLFEKEPFHPLLDNHPLKGAYEGYRSINITGNWRAVYRMPDDATADFVALGTNSKLYE